MRILVVAPYAPYPLHGGAPIRMFNILAYLSRSGHEVHLLTGRIDGRGDPRETPLGDLCTTITTYPVQERTLWTWIQGALTSAPYPGNRFANAAYRDALDHTIEELDPDLLWANFLFMANAAADAASGEVPVLLDQHEAEVYHWRGYRKRGSIHERVFAAITLAKLHWYEPEVLSKLDAALAVAPAEAEHIRSRGPEDLRVYTVPNGIALDSFSLLDPPNPESREICFVGGMAVKRNADAACWFARSILPLVHHRMPDARFTIVGSDPLPEVRDLAELEGVRVTGTVADVRPYYERARAVVVPQRFGAGTKLKVLEALALGRALITTPNGLQGFDLEPGEEVLVGDTPSELARQVLNVLEDPKLGERLALAGRRAVAERYAWDTILSNLEPHVEALAAEV